MRRIVGIISIFVVIAVSLNSCYKDHAGHVPNAYSFNPTPDDPNARLPSYLPRMDIPSDNPSTKEGVELGRHLFYEPLLSGDGTQSCGSCHNQEYGFTDNELQFSEGIDGIEGSRNSMPIVNIGLRNSFFWDGRSRTLEDQAIEPVRNPIEMHSTWKEGLGRLNSIQKYRDMAYRAFGIAKLDSISASKAIAQFERSIISNNSKFDRYQRGEYSFTPEEQRGHELFKRDRKVIPQGPNPPIVIAGGDCLHCHPINTDFTDNFFRNNGLDLVYADSGRAMVTENPADRGKFKVPSLRNIGYTAPYMHDGRFETLEEVIDFYSEGVQPGGTVDPLMFHSNNGGVQLNDTDRAALKAFLLTLDDPDFITNPAYSDPNK